MGEEKLVSLVGEHGVGKTTIIKQFCENKFNPQTRPTIGADFGHKHCVIGSHEMEVTFWDLAGGQEYHEVRQHLLQDSHLCLLIIDVKDTSDNIVSHWMEQLTQYKILNIAILINKADLIQTSNEEMMIQSRLQEISTKYSTSVSLISAKTGKDITNYIESLLLQTV